MASPDCKCECNPLNFSFPYLVFLVTLVVLITMVTRPLRNDHWISTAHWVYIAFGTTAVVWIQAAAADVPLLPFMVLEGGATLVCGCGFFDEAMGEKTQRSHNYRPVVNNDAPGYELREPSGREEQGGLPKSDGQMAPI